MNIIQRFLTRFKPSSSQPAVELQPKPITPADRRANAEEAVASALSSFKYAAQKVADAQHDLEQLMTEEAQKVDEINSGIKKASIQVEQYKKLGAKLSEFVV